MSVNVEEQLINHVRQPPTYKDDTTDLINDIESIP